jgi:hypothetical protein
MHTLSGQASSMGTRLLQTNSPPITLANMRQQGMRSLAISCGAMPAAFSQNRIKKFKLPR